MLKYFKVVIPAKAGIRSGFYVFFICILLASCGFKPLYSNNPTVSGASGSVVPFHEISITNIPDRNGQYLRNQLVDTIYIQGYPDNPQYELNVSRPAEQIVRLGIQKDATATRGQMRITVSMDLKDRADGSTLLSRNLTATNSFNILDSQYTTNVSTDYARNRALDDIARQIVTQLSLYFQRTPTE